MGNFNGAINGILMGVYAVVMASCNKKTCNHRRKKRGVKNMKIRNCFCKYTIADNHVA